MAVLSNQPGNVVAPDNLAQGFDGGIGLGRYRAKPRRRFWLEFEVVQETAAIPPEHSTFALFPHLPTEIRLHIWACAVELPRVVAITCRSADADSADERPASLPSAPPPPPPLPVLLQVCRESHAVARTRYERAFAWKVPYSLADAGADGQRAGGPGCLFHFASDAVLLRGDLEPCDDSSACSVSAVYFLGLPDTRRVRHVACSAADLGVGSLLAGQLFARLFPLADRFSGADRLVIVPPRGLAAEYAVVQATTGASLVHEEESDSDEMAPADVDSLVIYNNICQRVWTMWTGQNKRRWHSTAAEGDNSLRTLYYSSDSRPENNARRARDQLRIVMVAEEKLEAYLAKADSL